MPPRLSITGARKAAIVIMALGEESAAKVFQHMDETDIERIAREVASMGNPSVEVTETVLTEFHQLTSVADASVQGGVDSARRLLDKSLGPESSRRIVEKVMKRVWFSSLEKANPQQLSKFLLGEHPQTVALILAHLNPANAAELISQLPEETRADVMMRMASLEDISPEVISRISSVIDQRVKSLAGASREQQGGVRAVAELFNRIERSVTQGTLDSIERRSAEMATKIRNLMFVFEDLAGIEEVGIREVANRADKKVLAMALKGASDEIKDRFFANMSKRAGELMKEDMELLGAVRLKDVEKAQSEIVAIVRKLEEEGLVTTGGDGQGDEYVQ